MQLSPEFAWNAGDRRQTPKGMLLPGFRKETYWCFSEDRVGTVPEIVEGVVERLEAVASWLQRNVWHQGKVEIYLWLMAESYPEVTLPSHLLKAMGDLHVELAFEVIPRAFSALAAESGWQEVSLRVKNPHMSSDEAAKSIGSTLPLAAVEAGACQRTSSTGHWCLSAAPDLELLEEIEWLLDFVADRQAAWRLPEWIGNSRELRLQWDGSMNTGGIIPPAMLTRMACNDVELSFCIGSQESSSPGPS